MDMNNHMIDIDFVMSFSNRDPSSKDYGYYKTMLTDCVQYLNDKNFYDVHNVTYWLKLKNLNSIFIINLFISFIAYLRKHMINHSEQLTWFNQRAFREMPLKQKNYVIVRIIDQYKECFERFILEYEIKQIKDKQTFYEELIEMNQSTKKQKQNLEIENYEKLLYTSDDDNYNFYSYLDDTNDDDYFYGLNYQ